MAVADVAPGDPSVVEEVVEVGAVVVGEHEGVADCGVLMVLAAMILVQVMAVVLTLMHNHLERYLVETNMAMKAET